MRRRRLRTVVGFNTHVGRDPRKVVSGIRRLIADTDADVIALQEARGYVTALRLAFPGWKVYAKSGWPDSDHSPVMARRSLSRGRIYGRGWGTVRIENGWTYEGTPKPGRTWTWVKVDGVRVLSLHRVRGGHGGNSVSYLEEAHALREWFAEHDGPMLAIGDANEGPADTRPNTMCRIARDVGGSLIFDRDDRGIDYALARGLTGTLTRTDLYGSNHRAAVLRIKETP